MTDTKHMESIIASGLAQLLSRNCGEAAPALLAEYGQALLEKNQVMDLTAITDPTDVATLHMLDCAALLNCGDFSEKNLIDVGSGAGFPGMVLQLLVPSLSVTVLDSLQKRLTWLDELAGNFGLPLRTVHGRAEEAGQDPAYREQFDLATARAVADLRLLSELCLPFVRVGGQFLAMKSADSAAELDAAQTAIQTLGGEVTHLYDYTIPHTQVTHRIIVIEKRRPTPAVYPRRWAKMQKKPL